MNTILKNIIILILASALFPWNYLYAFENKDKPDVPVNIQKEVSKADSTKKTEPNRAPPIPVEKDSKNEKNKTAKVSRRSLKFGETFILTDKTIANTFRIDSGKKWSRFSDKVMITYDILGQEDTSGKLRFQKQRFELNYKFYVSSFSGKQPFMEYYYSTDKPTRLAWKVLSAGIGKILPFGLKFDVGYGYKWGTLTKKETYKYDVVTLNLSNEKKFSKITVKQNLKNIAPRNFNSEKQPIYDYKSSLSTPITNNINGAVNFDWRYQKIPELNKEDWFNYTLKFGLTFTPIK
ncbi:hypothetical protein ACFL4Z_02950 [candidate division KSB1 bacterium]